MSEEKEKLDFYLQFKDKRKELNKELSDIATSTKINIKYLNAIEEGNFDVLPTVYIRLFLRTYAEALELIPEKILQEYNEHINVSNQQLKTSGVTYIKEKTGKKNKLNNKEPLFDFSSDNINNEEEKYSENYFLKPKKLILLFFIIISIISIYMFVYHLANKQKQNLINQKSNDNIVQQFYQNFDFDLNDGFELIIINNNPTKIKISSKNNNGNFEIIYNDDELQPENSRLIYDGPDNDVYFEIYNIKDISQITINKKSILNFIAQDNAEKYLIKGHVDRPNKTLEIIFYNK